MEEKPEGSGGKISRDSENRPHKRNGGAAMVLPGETVRSDAGPRARRQAAACKGGTMERLVELIKDLITRKFYGELVLKFEAGVIVQCKKTESIKLESMKP